MVDHGHGGGGESAGADQLTVRRSNLALVLGHLRSQGARSRARIAAETGLNKATVSSLVSELVARGLVREGDVARGQVGRPAQAVETDGLACGLGVEINVDYIAVHVTDLAGHDVHTDRRPVDTPTLGVEATLDAMAAAVAEAHAQTTAGGRTVVGITVAVPGMIEAQAGVVRLAPNLHWHSVPVLSALSTRLRALLDTAELPPLEVDNDANLAALAEYTVGAAVGVEDFVYLTGEVGIGAGIFVGGHVLRGHAGFAGEVGHMPIGDHSIVCGCSRRGCWETMAGQAAILAAVADPGDPVADPGLDVDYRMRAIRERADRGDARTVSGLSTVGKAIGLGASILADLFNPRMIVLGGFMVTLADYLLPALQAELAARVVEPALGESMLTLSSLGFTASARGAAQQALQHLLSDPTAYQLTRPTLAAAGGQT